MSCVSGTSGTIETNYFDAAVQRQVANDLAKANFELEAKQQATVLRVRQLEAEASDLGERERAASARVAVLEAEAAATAARLTLFQESDTMLRAANEQLVAAGMLKSKQVTECKQALSDSFWRQVLVPLAALVFVVCMATQLGSGNVFDFATWEPATRSTRSFVHNFVQTKALPAAEKAWEGFVYYVNESAKSSLVPRRPL